MFPEMLNYSLNIFSTHLKSSQLINREVLAGSPFFHLSIHLSLPLFTESREPVQPSADFKEASGKPHPGPQPQASECVCPS